MTTEGGFSLSQKGFVGYEWLYESTAVYDSLKRERITDS